MCREEAPRAEALYRAVPRKRIDFVGVNVNNEDPRTVMDFVIGAGATYRQFRDQDNRAAMAFQANGIPWAVLIDKRGRIRYQGNRLPTPAMVKWVL